MTRCFDYSSAVVVLGFASNGWTIWKAENGDFIETFNKRK